MRYLLGVLFLVFSFTVFGIRYTKSIEIKQNVTGLLKRAADAGTVELANGEMMKVIQYLEEKDLTEGSTSVFWDKPEDDIGFWYQNLKASQQELSKLSSNSPLENTNVLIKLRETLLDQGEKTRVTIPDGLSVFPNNGFWYGLTFLALVALLPGILLVIPPKYLK